MKKIKDDQWWIQRISMSTNVCVFVIVTVTVVLEDIQSQYHGTRDVLTDI